MNSSKLFLLADDDRDDAELFGEAIAGISPALDFMHVENGKDVFDYLDDPQARRPDIIFLDLNMPEMSGWQCLVKLKDDVRFAGIPVIMYSTSSHQRDKSIAMDLGAIGFLTKPTDFKVLQRVLQNIAGADTSDIGKLLMIISLAGLFKWRNYRGKVRINWAIKSWWNGLRGWFLKGIPQVS